MNSRVEENSPLSLQMINMGMSAAWDLGMVRLVCVFHKQPTVTTLLLTFLCCTSTSGLKAGWSVSILLFKDNVVGNVYFKWTSYKEAGKKIDMKSNYQNHTKTEP